MRGGETVRNTNSLLIPLNENRITLARGRDRGEGGPTTILYSVYCTTHTIIGDKV